MQWKQFVIAASIGVAAVSTPAPAQESQLAADEPEWAPVVKRLSSDDLPPALGLTTSAVSMVKRTESDPSLAKLYFKARGLDVTDTDLDYLVTLYGDFDERHRVRHNRVLREHAGEPEKIEASGERYKMERAAFTGGVLGAWLSHMRSKGQDTDRFVVEVVTEEDASFFWGGRAPTYESLERQASAFEESFEREYGIALPALLDAGSNGGGR